jgi:heme-binding protein
MRTKGFLAAGLLVAGVGLLVAQLASVPVSNPPVTGDISAPPQIESMLRRACYDCHSNQTRWPWYGRIAPLSWLAAHDVARGRQELNFSEWGSYHPVYRKRKLQWIGRALREKTMPQWWYVLMHPDARLTEQERAALERWIDSQLFELEHPTEKERNSR